MIEVTVGMMHKATEKITKEIWINLVSETLRTNNPRKKAKTVRDMELVVNIIPISILEAPNISPAIIGVKV